MMERLSEDTLELHASPWQSTWEGVSGNPFRLCVDDAIKSQECTYK